MFGKVTVNAVTNTQMTSISTPTGWWEPAEEYTIRTHEEWAGNNGGGVIDKPKPKKRPCPPTRGKWWER